MNEQNNITLIQNVYAAFGRGDVQTMLDNMTPDIDWTSEGPAVIPFAGHKTGPAEVVQFFQALGTTQEDQKLTIDSYIAQGDLVATIGRYSAVIKATGKRVDSSIAHFFTIRNGKVAKYHGFMDTAMAVDAYTSTAAAAH